MRFRECRVVRIHYRDGLRLAHVTKLLACGHELADDFAVVDVGLETFRATMEAVAVGGAYACKECLDEDPPQLPPAVAGPAAPAGPEVPGAIARTTRRPL